MLLILILAIAGIALILLDFIFIPGMVIGFLGGALIIYSTYLNYMSYGPWPALVEILIVLAAMPKTVLWSMRRAALKNEMTKEKGFVGVTDHRDLVGRKGKALSDLRPSGSVGIQEGGELTQLDCITDGEYIDSGSEVLIVASRGPSLVVRSVAASAAKT